MLYSFTYSQPSEAPAMAYWLTSQQGCFRRETEERIRRGKLSPGDYARVGIKLHRNDLLLLIKNGALGRYSAMRYDGTALVFKNKQNTTTIYPPALGINQELHTGDIVVFDKLPNTNSRDIIPHLSLY